MNGIANYFQGVVTELRKVSWPTMPVVFRHFLSVIFGVICATALVGLFDYLFFKLLAKVLGVTI